MKLHLYLSENKITEAAFAEAIGVTRISVARYKAGRVPEAEVMDRIIEATSGAVTPNDFFDLPSPSEAVAAA